MLNPPSSHPGRHTARVVRRRSVFYFSGFDPQGASHYHALYRDEALKHFETPPYSDAQQEQEDMEYVLKKLGFTRAIIPKANKPKQAIAGMEIIVVGRLDEAVANFR